MKRRLIAGVFVAVTISGMGAVDIGASPIDCPSSQTAVKVDGGWACENPAGQHSGAEDPKNPNAGKHDF